MESKVVTLTYWHGRGLCESIRLMLAACQVEYEEQVPGFPEDVSHLAEAKHLNHLRENDYLLFNQVPLLCIDGLRLVQSQAIVRYLAAKHSLCGDGTLTQRTQCDMIAEGLKDWRAKIGMSFEFSVNGYEPSPEQITKIREGNAKYLPLFERILVNTNTGFFVGSAWTYADYLALEPLEQIKSYNNLENFPRLQALHKALLQVPQLAAWLKSDKRKSQTQDNVTSALAAVRRTLY